MPIRGLGSSPYAAGTVVTASYLPWVRVTANSFLDHNPGAEFHILFTDRIPEDDLRPEDRFIPHALADIGLDPEEIAWLEIIYTDLELCCALKPALIRTMLGRAPVAIYIDADMKIYDSLAEVATLASDTGLLLSPHALSPRGLPGVEQEEVLFRMGLFNAGFLGVSHNGLPFLDWWWSKTRRECHDISVAPQNQFLDQKWLDVAVSYFPNVIHRDVTTNLARWNLFQRELSFDGDRFRVDGMPLKLFHFSNFDPARLDRLRPDDFDHPSVAPAGSPALSRLINEYVQDLADAGWRPSTAPKVSRYFDDIEMTTPVRLAINSALIEAESHPSTIFPITVESGQLLKWLATFISEGGLTWFLYGLHRSNPAVRGSFPEVPGKDEPGYVQWAITAGPGAGLVPASVAARIREGLFEAGDPIKSEAASAPQPPSAPQAPTGTAPPTAKPSDEGVIRASDELLRFTAEMRNERESILRFAIRAASEIPSGNSLLDVGAGNSPYRELFGHLRYESNDWAHSMHPGARAVDHVGPAHAIPVPDASYDSVLCTQVLEHVPNPQEVLNEISRVLKPGGDLYMTLPLAWELHELPFDFYRYTPHGLAHMLTTAGFGHLDIHARNSSFETVAQLVRNLPSMIGPYPDGKDGARSQLHGLLGKVADQLDAMSGLDSRWIFPLGFSIRATKSDPTKITDMVLSGTERDATLASVGIAEARGFVVVCFAVDLFADPRILHDYSEHFAGADDATLVIYAPEVDVGIASHDLTRLVTEAGLDGPGSPDMIALPYTGRADEPRLAAAVDAVLSYRPPWGAFAGKRWLHTGNLAAARSGLTNQPEARA